MLTSCWDLLRMLASYAYVISFFVTTKCKKKSGKLMKIVDIDGENLHIFWTTWGISMKLSGKMWLMMILKVTKTTGFKVRVLSKLIYQIFTEWMLQLSASFQKIKLKYLN